MMETNDTFSTPYHGNGTDPDRMCQRFEQTKHILLQASNLCFAVAFLIPHKFQYGMLAIRGLLSVGFLLGSLWAGLLVCAPDVLAWNLILFFLNFIHAMYLFYKHCPPHIDPELLDLYIKVFTPVKVKKKHFLDLIQNANVHSLDPDECYAMEGITTADHRLSILLSGRMKATCEDVLLHYIMPTEFIDSPEWESCRTDREKLFQVTITATERCRLITWNRQSLENLLNTNRFLDVIMYNLIGKDITHKLYSLNEHHKTDDAKLSSVALPDLWRHQMSKSLSVDAVHTGAGGRVRSLIWRNQQRRTSTTLSESLGSSPVVTPRHMVHYSDPGPVGSPNKQQSHRFDAQIEEFQLCLEKKNEDA